MAISADRHVGDAVNAQSGVCRDADRKPLKTLLILRHAKSSWSDSSIDDHERPLNQRGRRDGPQMGKLLRELELTPDLIITSDAVRARDTAEAVAEAADYGGTIRPEHRLYAATPADILGVLRATPDAHAGSVMIVGHNPGLEELVAQLTGEHEDLPTAALVHVALPIDRWRDLKGTTRGELVGIWRPKEL
jgi:phosphohistidine phosphatase